MQPLSTLSPRLALLFGSVGAASIGLAIDAIIFAIRPPTPAATPGLPPAWFVGSMWVLLFGLMGAAWSLLLRSHAQTTLSRWSIVLLLILCAAYPFYTGMFQSRRAELAGNAVTIVCALLVALLCWRFSRAAGLLILPTAAWVGYATILTLRLA